MNWIAHLFFGLYLVSYFAFTGYTVYMVLVGEKKLQVTTIGKLIWWHGAIFIGSLCASAIIGMALVFAIIILRAIGMIGV